MKNCTSEKIPRQISRGLAILATVLLPACVPPAPRLGAQMGSAVDTARMQQIANPRATGQATPVTGIDGQAGSAVFDNYRDSFVNPRPALSGGVVNIGSGRAGSGGGGTR